MNLEKKICYLIGNPVEHSLSPVMHQKIYRKMGLNDWVYKLKKIDQESEIERFVLETKNNNYVGFNVTVPYKQKVMKYIDKVEKEADRIGAVNTVVNKDSFLHGYNTDWIGFLEDLKVSIDYRPMEEEKILVIGGGGAGRAVIQGLGAEIKKDGIIYLYDLNTEKVEKIISDFKGYINIRKIKKEDIYPVLADVDLLVNATPVGMKQGDKPVLNLDHIRKGINFKTDLKVYDVVYNRETELIKQAKKHNLTASGGIGMLVRQGVESFKLWSGIENIDNSMVEEIKIYLNKEVR
ncbi:MAG: shikimate dehydrogenase [Elusimicrobiota bacterium]